MKTSAPHINPRRLLLVAAALAAASLLFPPVASGYGWPVKPFDRQHPVRGFFGDPRIADGRRTGSLHFGVDVVAADGTPVYATITGTVSIPPHHGRTVRIVAGGRAFEYWHVVPTVRTGDWARAYDTVIGRVQAPWAHVHLAECVGGRFVNPLRPGAMAPYRDGTQPEARMVTAERLGRPVRIGRLAGRVDLVTEVRDWMPVAAPAPWTGKPVMPAVIRWRLVSPLGPGRWHTSFDVRESLPSCGYGGVYARWTRQNKPWREGRYRVYLAHELDTRAYADGAYQVEVEAVDTGGNQHASSTTVVVRNA